MHLFSRRSRALQIAKILAKMCAFRTHIFCVACIVIIIVCIWVDVENSIMKRRVIALDDLMYNRKVCQFHEKNSAIVNASMQRATRLAKNSDG